jgi:hypothetical protein
MKFVLGNSVVIIEPLEFRQPSNQQKCQISIARDDVERF